MEIYILELAVKRKYARISKKGHESDEMSFRLHEANYDWKMLADFKWSFKKFGECYGPVNIIF